MPIGFDANFFGRTYRTLYVNNNGNITFEGPLDTYVPFGLNGTHIPIIAAFFADVDTRGYRSEAVTYGTDFIDGRRAFGVDFFSVGYFKEHDDRLNTFQLILVDRSDTGPGNFDIEFNYARINWDVGDKSEGVGAVVGFSNGTGQPDSLFQLPGSMYRGAFLDHGPYSLVRHRLNSDVDGRYVFHARSGRVSSLQIVPASLPDGTVGQPYSAPALTASGGVPPYTWSPVSWPPDLGLRINPDTGAITGIPNHGGEYQLTVQVADRAGTPPARHVFSLKIKDLTPPPTPPTPTPAILTLPTPSPIPAPTSTARSSVTPTSSLAHTLTEPTPSPTPGPGAPFTPYLIAPREATVNRPVRVVAGLRNVTGPRPPGLAVQVRFSGQAVSLHDDGLDGDEVAGDGRYSAQVVFANAGKVPVVIHATSGALDVSGEDVIRVWGNVVPSGPIELNLGKLKAGGESCQPLSLGEQQGAVPFEFRLLQALPAGHRITLRANPRIYAPGNAALILGPAEARQICLDTSGHAPSSMSGGEPWLELMIEAAEGKEDLAAIHLRWQVESLSFWERWGWLILILLLIFLVWLIVYGYIRPYRFPREVAVTFVPEYADLDASPQPLSQWPGVGIGFYRDARAFLHPDFRISGKSKGALGMLRASKQGVWVVPVGSSLFREIDLSDWEELQGPGRLVRAAVSYRFSDRGPFFRISSSLGKRS